MSWIRGYGPFFIFILIGFWLTIALLFDVIYNKQWTLIILFFYIFLIISVIFLLIFRTKKEEVFINPFEEFEKSLTGMLFHFKCPICNGFFAIKKSKGNNKKNIKMTCPDCGKIGVITPNPDSVEEEIPQKKSVNVNFRCSRCGEGLIIWAEGTDLCNDIKVFSCPFCGKNNTMNRF